MVEESGSYDKQAKGAKPYGETASESGPASAPNMTTGQEAAAKAAAPPSIPPISPQQISQFLSLAVSGAGLPQQQNPEATRHITEFLAHDSDNRLKAVEGAGTRNHKFRMNALYVGTGLAVLFFGAPLGVELYRGDITFVRDFVEKYLPGAVMIILALFAGPKFTDLFKG